MLAYTVSVQKVQSFHQYNDNRNHKPILSNIKWNNENNLLLKLVDMKLIESRQLSQGTTETATDCIGKNVILGGTRFWYLEIFTQVHQLHFHIVGKTWRSGSWSHQHRVCVCTAHMDTWLKWQHVVSHTLNFVCNMCVSDVLCKKWFILKLYTDTQLQSYIVT